MLVLKNSFQTGSNLQVKKYSLMDGKTSTTKLNKAFMILLINELF